MYPRHVHKTLTVTVRPKATPALASTPLAAPNGSHALPAKFPTFPIRRACAGPYALQSSTSQSRPCCCMVHAPRWTSATLLPLWSGAQRRVACASAMQAACASLRIMPERCAFAARVWQRAWAVHCGSIHQSVELRDPESRSRNTSWVHQRRSQRDRRGHHHLPPRQHHHQHRGGIRPRRPPHHPVPARDAGVPQHFTATCASAAPKAHCPLTLSLPGAYMRVSA